nr:hypothetical protein [Tanacetum cinerariifolium]
MFLASSAVTYTSVYTDSEPGRVFWGADEELSDRGSSRVIVVFWGADEELSDRGSSRVIVYGYDGLPMLPVATPSTDYIPGLKDPHTPPAPQDEDEHEPMFIQPHVPDFVLEPVYPEYIPLEDEHILTAEEQPLPPSPVIHQPPQEMGIQEMEDLKQQYFDEIKRLINLEYCDEIKIDELKRNFNITPSLSTEEPDNSLSMGDEHLDTISVTESDEFIKSSVENLIPIPSESEGIPDNMCDVAFHDNSPPLDVLKDQFEDFFDSNDEFSSTDDDSFSINNIDYVEASPPDSELVSSEAMEIVILEIEALNDNPTPSSDFMTKSSSTSLNSLLEETNTFDNSLPEFETFCFDVEDISSGSTTTHSDSSLYDSFIFDLSINPFPPADRSDFYEFADELIHIISPPKYDCFFFKIEPNSRDFTMDVVEDISPT